MRKVNIKALWFGDERGYNATTRPSEETTPGCGLVMKEDITQRSRFGANKSNRCGLVMKEDITQPVFAALSHSESCGLVMKEDITQQLTRELKQQTVVVW